MEKRTILSQETLVPIGLIGVIFGAAMWLTSIWKQGEANASQIVEVKQNHDKNMDRIYDKLEKIADKLDHLIEKNEK